MTNEYIEIGMEMLFRALRLFNMHKKDIDEIQKIVITSRRNELTELLKEIQQ